MMENKLMIPIKDSKLKKKFPLTTTTKIVQYFLIINVDFNNFLKYLNGNNVFHVAINDFQSIKNKDMDDLHCFNIIS